MHRIICLNLLISFSLSLFAQYQQEAVRQHGFVRTITYSKQHKNQPIKGVRIKAEVETESDENGNFLLSIAYNKNNTFTFDYIIKTGYTLVAPQLQSAIPLNSKTKTEIILARNEDLYEERLRIEETIRNQKQKEINEYLKTIHQKDSILSQLIDKNKHYRILLNERDSIYTAYLKFSAQYYQSDKLIQKEAEELARTDYQSLDSIELKSIELRKAGKGRELVELNKIFLPQYEDKIINKITDNINLLEGNINTLEIALQKEKTKFKRQKEYRNFLIKRYKNIADGFALQYINDSVTTYLKKRVILDPDNYDYSISYADWLCNNTSNFKEAINTYTCLLTKTKLVTEHLSKQHIIELYDKLAYCYYLDKNNSTSLSYYNKVLHELKSNSTLPYINIIITYSNIGNVLHSSGDYTKALEYFDKASEISENILKKKIQEKEYQYTPQQNAKLSIIENKQIIEMKHNENNRIFTGSNISAVYFKQALKDSIHLYKVWGNQEIKIDSIRVTDNNLKIANICGILASIYQLQEREVLDLYKYVLTIKKRYLGTDHLDIAILLDNIGKELYTLKKYDEALQYYTESLQIKKKKLGTFHSNIAATYDDIGSVYSMQGNYTEALKNYSMALKIRENFLDTMNIENAFTYNDIGNIYYKNNNIIDAIEYYKKSIQICSSKLKNNPNTIAVYENIANAYLKLGGYEKAINYYCDALGTVGDNLKDSPLYTITTSKDFLNTLEQISNKIRNNSFKQIPIQENIIFTLTLQRKDNTVYDNNIYYILKYKDWDCESENSLFPYIATTTDEFQDILLMLNGEIIENLPNDKNIKYGIDIRSISENEKQQIISTYRQQKNDNSL
ncbi:tetratricopeptide repeat protein [Bacteroides sp.]|uniref:tetratricopeptide repeat protein n=1 Tax=Bacteroides sp. TaxID=29523 RepID=UPI002611AD31|nr:tetratricopeptide repeat protein [Bacteroides sp.]